jgi:Ca2+/Na+ antiporter
MYTQVPQPLRNFAWLLGLLAALAADTPEITSAVTALIHGEHEVSTGVVLGSNVFNLAALLGLGAVVAGRIRLHRRVVIFEGSLALWIAALSIAAAASLITPAAALVLALAMLAPYVYVSALQPSSRTGLPAALFPEGSLCDTERATGSERERC